ncbi:glutathione S-transferase family protein [Asticcacaulis sp. BYS171W]|uniref:Glutathione S-transferase family protein n=1 Tax=Asticcacaulis aquaticus TaxID=2984212 RepID=A0ABT5HXL5_9CAUL|nr:glutathione S-transferase family protein [Asticcacaulis aquaticus]MDC7684811.1 glutathione S-transferase family protein [Asticcacaulis aquaticus]
MYDLHIANKNYSSWSLRPWVLLRELDIPFTEHQHYFTTPVGENVQFKAFSPTALVPALQDDGTTVWDSLAIAEYVHEAHPAVWPGDREARAFARSAAAEMHSGFSALRNTCTMNCGLRIDLNDVSAPLLRNIDRLDALFREGLERFGGPFLAGPAFTAVDAFYCPVAFRVQTYGLTLSAPSQAYIERLLNLPSMQAWYAEAIGEAEREPEHEDEAQAAGTITADYRIG